MRLTSQASFKQALLVFSQLANRVDLLDTIGTKLNPGGEEVNTLVLVQRTVDESALDDTGLALGSLQQAFSEAGTSHGHGQGSGAGTVLGLDDLVTTELDAVDESVELLAGDVAVAGLGDEGNDGSAGVTTYDGNLLVGGVGTLDLGDEAGGTDDIEGGDTEEALGVVDTLALEDFGADGNGRVDLEGVRAD
jgi:hypothetical protein